MGIKQVQTRTGWRASFSVKSVLILSAPKQTCPRLSSLSLGSASQLLFTRVSPVAASPKPLCKLLWVQEQYIFYNLRASTAATMVSGVPWCSTTIYWTHINNQFFFVGQNEAYKATHSLPPDSNFLARKFSICTCLCGRRLPAGFCWNVTIFFESPVKMKNLKRRVFGVSFL